MREKERQRQRLSVSSTLGLHIAMLLVNILASVGLHLLERFNKRKHRRYEGKMGLPKYILSEKYQIAENLKTFEVGERRL